jgi:hypothetical protein
MNELKHGTRDYWALGSGILKNTIRTQHFRWGIQHSSVSHPLTRGWKHILFRNVVILEYRMMGNVQKRSNPECCIPLPEPFRIYLSIEIKRIWTIKCFVILVVIGATEVITKGLKEYLETSWMNWIVSTKIGVLLGTLHVVRKIQPITVAAPS